MEKAYILGGIRSDIGIENGKYCNIPAEKLGAAVFKQLLEKASAFLCFIENNIELLKK